MGQIKAADRYTKGGLGGCCIFFRIATVQFCWRKYVIEGNWLPGIGNGTRASEHGHQGATIIKTWLPNFRFVVRYT